MKITASPSAKKNNIAFQNFLRNAAAITLFAAPYAASMMPTEATATDWTYNFGSAASTSVTTTSNIPAASGGVTYVRVGTGGSINLNNPGDANLGTAAELNLTTTTSASPTIFSIADWTATSYFDVSAQIVYTIPTASQIDYFLIGNGNNFTTAGGYVAAQTAAGFRFGSTGLTGLYNGGAWTTTNVSSTSSMSANTVLNLRVIGNYSTAAMNYSLGSSTFAIAAGRAD
jgi:hypothetical protein